MKIQLRGDLVELIKRHRQRELRDIIDQEDLQDHDLGADLQKEFLDIYQIIR